MANRIDYRSSEYLMSDEAAAKAEAKFAEWLERQPPHVRELPKLEQMGLHIREEIEIENYGLYRPSE